MTYFYVCCSGYQQGDINRVNNIIHKIYKLFHVVIICCKSVCYINFYILVDELFYSFFIYSVMFLHKWVLFAYLICFKSRFLSKIIM